MFFKGEKRMSQSGHSKESANKDERMRTFLKFSIVCVCIAILLLIGVLIFGDKIINKKTATAGTNNAPTETVASETASQSEPEESSEPEIKIETVTMYTTIDLNVRSTPDTTVNDNILGEVKKGGEVAVTEKGEKWHKVLFEGKEGYCYAKYLSEQKPEETPVETVKSGESPYYIKVNRSQNIVTIYKADENGEYTIPFKAMTCSVGRDGKTPLGTWKTSDKFRWGWLSGGVCGQYSTRIYKAYLFHSVPYFTQNSGDLEYEEYNKLGQPASLGCVRLCVADAKWIYDNCPAGTSVTIYDSSDPEPLPAPAPIRIDVNDSRRGWDPTDPDPNNPWNTNP